MPVAKARGDTNTYADVSYEREGSRIRIRAARFSALKQYASPYSLVVGPDASGRWLIYEEHSITKP
jgi:ketosteroid isomerase-like protein